MADIISGYVVYAPATLVIKALMAAVSWGVYTSLVKHFRSFPARIAAAAAAELVMASGYVLFESFMYHSFSAAVAGVPANLVQGIMGAVTSVAIYELVIKRIPKLVK